MHFKLMANLWFLHSNIKISRLQRTFAGSVNYYNHDHTINFWIILKNLRMKTKKKKKCSFNPKQHVPSLVDMKSITKSLWKQCNLECGSVPFRSNQHRTGTFSPQRSNEFQRLATQGYNFKWVLSAGIYSSCMKWGSEKKNNCGA